jgi:adenylate kinase family enzyme
MNKVIILGSPGSGKSTFAKALQKLTNLPLYHLDNIWWKRNKTHISRAEFDLELNNILCQKNWIIDGDYSRTYEIRLKYCDTVFFLDYPVDICLEGINKRLNKNRDDIPYIDTSLDDNLVNAILEYPTTKRVLLLELFNQYKNKNIHILKSRFDAETFLKENNHQIIK